jgi:hypothetical protein
MSGSHHHNPKEAATNCNAFTDNEESTSRLHAILPTFEPTASFQIPDSCHYYIYYLQVFSHSDYKLRITD